MFEVMNEFNSLRDNSGAAIHGADYSTSAFRSTALPQPTPIRPSVGESRRSPNNYSNTVISYHSPQLPNLNYLVQQQLGASTDAAALFSALAANNPVGFDLQRFYESLGLIQQQQQQQQSPQQQQSVVSCPKSASDADPVAIVASAIAAATGSVSNNYGHAAEERDRDSGNETRSSASPCRQSDNSSPSHSLPSRSNSFSMSNILRAAAAVRQQQQQQALQQQQQQQAQKHEQLTVANTEPSASKLMKIEPMDTVNTIKEITLSQNDVPRLQRQQNCLMEKPTVGLTTNQSQQQLRPSIFYSSSQQQLQQQQQPLKELNNQECQLQLLRRQQHLQQQQRRQQMSEAASDFKNIELPYLHTVTPMRQAQPGDFGPVHFPIPGQPCAPYFAPHSMLTPPVTRHPPFPLDGRDAALYNSLAMAAAFQQQLQQQLAAVSQRELCLICGDKVE